jgi:cellulose synthase/poly-beta-1,6-N-acetylglucosamine synthase-like glycosyltransferase
MPILYSIAFASIALIVYTYAGYPLILSVLGLLRRRSRPPAPPAVWPMVSISLPVYNEEAQIGKTLESLLALDYPRDRLQIVVISDASTDRTDEIVEGFADRGVELFRLPRRGGKTAAENAARYHLRGEIIINTDASIRLAPDSIKALVAWFGDPTVGVASGRDVSIGRVSRDANAGESGYVGYEMWVRSLETRVDGIVGASGSLYAIRAELHRYSLPEALSRDFAAALVAREAGYRAVSVPEAVCYVPRAPSLRREYRRKVRTITRGLGTLHYKRHLLNPLRHGVFAWMLFSHKLCRWLVPWALALLAIAVAALALVEPWARVATAAMGLGLALAAAGWLWPAERGMPRWLGIPTYLVAGNVAALHAWIRAFRGELNPIWEPTRREPVRAG